MTIMRTFKVKESLYEKIEDDEPDVEIEDSWNKPDEDDDVEVDPDEIDTTDMETAEEIDIPDAAFDDELLMTLNNELKSPEFARRVLRFRVKGADRRPEFGTVLAKIGDNGFIFKLQDGTMKKYKLQDIIAESIKYPNEMHLDENWGEGFDEDDRNDEYHTLEDEGKFDDESDDEFEDESYEIETIDPEDEEYLMTMGHLFPDEAKKVMSRYTKVPRRGSRGLGVDGRMPF